MKRFIHSLLFPHARNNYRANLIQNTGLFIVTLLFVVLGLAFQYVHEKKPEILGISYSISENELLSLVNTARQENNLPPLTGNDVLSSAAEKKAQHMFDNNYWAHFAPDGTTPWTFIRGSGYNYVYAGENLAKGFTNSSEIVNAWMNSPSHRDNILSDRYQDVGFAIVEGRLNGEETILVVEMFGATDVPPAIAAAPQEVEVSVNTQDSETPSALTTQEVLAQPRSPEERLLGQEVKNTSGSSVDSSFLSTPQFDANVSVKTIALIVFFIILIVLIIDLIYTERKKIPRMVGHNLDHIMIVILFILFIILQTNGGIL